jgi:lipoate---protein ligase
MNTGISKQHLNETNTVSVPFFPGILRKNDALFLYGATQKKPSVVSYEQELIEVVHGPSCRIDDEIQVNTCTKSSVPICERRGGGGTVVLSPGMCITIITGTRENLNALGIFNRIHSAMIKLLEQQGIKKLNQQGISDVTIDGQKILGSSLYLGTKPACYYYQSSLMVSSDIHLLNQYLKYPPKEPDYRNSRPHDSFCTTLHAQGYMVPANTICRLFETTLPDLLR